MVTIDDFSKIEIRVGLVTEAVNKEGSEKLIRLKVSFGPKVENAPDLTAIPSLIKEGEGGSSGVGEEIRIIFTGVRKYGYTPEDFLNKKFLFVTNLEYRKMMDEESQGMILAVGALDEKPLFVSAGELPVGAKVR